jgi:pilus assembly protein Flp/PilA
MHFIPATRPLDDRSGNWFVEILRDERAATAIEYGLIAALIAVAAVVVMGTVGTNLSSVFSTVAGDL